MDAAWSCFVIYLLFLFVFKFFIECSLLICLFRLQEDVHWRIELGDYRSYVKLAPNPTSALRN